MIARPLPYEDLDVRPRTGTRSGRTAAHVRRKRNGRLRYAGVGRIFATVGCATLAIVVYLALMANVTRLNYELAKTVRLQAQLVDESSRYDDTIARLESRERLAVLAARLGMKEPQTFAEIALPLDRPVEAPRGLAFLPWLK